VTWTTPLLAGLVVTALGAPVAWAVDAIRPAAAAAAGRIVALVGCALGLLPALAVLLGAAPLEVSAPWSVPFGAFHLRLDGLAALFLALVFAISAVLLAAAARAQTAASQGWFSLLIAAMALVVLARNVVLFLFAWEAMAVTSFLLIAERADDDEAREGAWTYLIATHLGTAFLLAMLPLLAAPGGLDIHTPIDFDGAQSIRLGGGRANLLFVLAVLGFGTKAALAPMHAWVGKSYRAMPSWVAASSSALMAKVSLYVMFRTILQLGQGHATPAWWGLVLIGLGLLSGLIGLGGALGSRRIKEVLGYSSVENVGIICVGFGLGLAAVAEGRPAVAMLGFAGALFHVINHAILKAAMFTAAGLVERATGTDDLAHLGGLLRRMPVVGACLGVGAIALSGVPPLNAFASEWLIYRGLFKSTVGLGAVSQVAAMVAIAGMALIGGLAATCFCGLFGFGFLGVARSEEAATAAEPPAGDPARRALVGLIAAAAVVGVFPSLGVWLVRGPALAMGAAVGLRPEPAAMSLAFGPVGLLSAVALLLLGLSWGLARARDRRLAAAEVSTGATWDCGFAYTGPFPRGQYNPASFVDPLAPLLAALVAVRERKWPIEGNFPAAAAIEQGSDDLVAERLLRPVFHLAGQGMLRLRWIQRGSIQLYLLFLFATLVIMLIWQVLV
jgi:hydrogenase-4 component B